MGSILVRAHARSNLKMASFFEIFINNSYYFKNDNNNSNIILLLLLLFIIIIIIIIIRVKQDFPILNSYRCFINCLYFILFYFFKQLKETFEF